MIANPAVSLVLTLIGDDRPGVVGQLSRVISEHQGNWLESSMSHLSGKFAGIVSISVPRAQVEPLKAALAALPGLRINAETTDNEDAPADAPEQRKERRLKLSLVGHDRIGIVREVSQVLTRHRVNVENLSTHTASAPMSAAILFYATAELTAQPSLDTRELTRDLEALSNDLMVDIALDEAIRT